MTIFKIIQKGTTYGGRNIAVIYFFSISFTMRVFVGCQGKWQKYSHTTPAAGSVHITYLLCRL